MSPIISRLANHPLRSYLITYESKDEVNVYHTFAASRVHARTEFLRHPDVPEDVVIVGVERLYKV